jgi:hypothetical protein
VLSAYGNFLMRRHLKLRLWMLHRISFLSFAMMTIFNSMGDKLCDIRQHFPYVALSLLR